MSWGKQKARHTSETAGTTIQQTPVKTCLSLPIEGCSSTALHLSLSLSLEFLSLYKTTTLSSQYDTSTTLYNLYILLCSLLHRELITFSILSLTLSLSLSRSKTKTGKLRLSIFSSFLKRCRFCFILTHSFIFRMIQWFN